jgi:hypothetical protein
MDGELRLQISEEGAGAERLAVLVGYLRRNSFGWTLRT